MTVLDPQAQTAGPSANPEPAQCRQLQRWPDRVDPKTEAEQVHLKTLAGGEQDTEEPIER